MIKASIERSGQLITLPQEVLDDIYGSGRYITLNKKKRSYGYYYQVMVCKKEKSKIVERVGLGRRILGAPKNIHVDHIDRNPLNNMPENLRLTTFSLNGANRTKGTAKFKYKGVAKKKHKYYASCTKDGIRYSASSFDTELEAAYYYDKLAALLFGPHAGLNFPEINCLSMTMPEFRKHIKEFV